MGAGIAMHIATQYSDLVRQLVVASVTYNNSGFLPRLIAGMENLKPENLADPLAGGICPGSAESGRMAHASRKGKTTEPAYHELAC